MSRKELQELVHAGVLTQDEIEDVISIEFNPVSARHLGTLIPLHSYHFRLLHVSFDIDSFVCHQSRVAFTGKSELWVTDILNLGVS